MTCAIPCQLLCAVGPVLNRTVALSDVRTISSDVPAVDMDTQRRKEIDMFGTTVHTSVRDGWQKEENVQKI